MIVLSYLGPLALIPLTAERDPDVRWHARHGLVLFAATLATAVLLGALATVPGLGCLIIALVLFLPPAWLAIALICMVKAHRGERFPVPAITALTDRLPDLSRRAWIIAVAAAAAAVALWLFLFAGLEVVATALGP